LPVCKQQKGLLNGRLTGLMARGKLPGWNRNGFSRA
jgi:hypothetical protein